MDRVNVYAYHDDRPPKMRSWFDRDKATAFPAASGDTVMYRTANDLWVMHTPPDRHELVTDEQAKGWLADNGHEWTEPETEWGRPTIGSVETTRLPPETVAEVKALAKRWGVKKADALRQLVHMGLEHVRTSNAAPD